MFIRDRSASRLGDLITNGTVIIKLNLKKKCMMT